MKGLAKKLSPAVISLILAGASAPVLMDQFLNEKEGNSLTSYRDGSGIWTDPRRRFIIVPVGEHNNVCPPRLQWAVLV